MKKLLVLMLSVLLLTSCGSKPVATVGNIKITQSEFEFYLDSIKMQMSDTELQTEKLVFLEKRDFRAHRSGFARGAHARRAAANNGYLHTSSFIP